MPKIDGDLSLVKQKSVLNAPLISSIASNTNTNAPNVINKNHHKLTVSQSPWYIERTQHTMSLPEHNLSPEELSEFREIFNLVDRDGGGTITKEELGERVEGEEERGEQQQGVVAALLLKDKNLRHRVKNVFSSKFFHFSFLEVDKKECKGNENEGKKKASEDNESVTRD